MDKQENLALWNCFLKGDEKAFLQIYKLYAREMYAYGSFFTDNEEMVKDCLHNVFVKIHRNRENLSQVDNIKPYLFMAMKSQLFDMFNKNYKYDFCNGNVELVFSPEYVTAEDDIISREEQDYRNEKVQEMLASLTPRQKEVLYYRYLENLSYQEIGEIMEMNYQSILNLIQRSLQKLRTTYTRSELYLPYITGLALWSIFL